MGEKLLWLFYVVGVGVQLPDIRPIHLNSNDYGDYVAIGVAAIVDP